MEGSVEPRKEEVKADREARPDRKKARGKTKDEGRRAEAPPKQSEPELADDDGSWNGPVPSFLGQGLAS